MIRLFSILDGIIESGYAADTLASTDAVINYAESCGESITDSDAKRIIEAGKKWLDEQKNGNGEWSRMRHEAMAALE